MNKLDKQLRLLPSEVTVNDWGPSFRYVPSFYNKGIEDFIKIIVPESGVYIVEGESVIHPRFIYKKVMWLNWDGGYN